VPLLLRGPGVRARRVSEPAQGIDVAPTLLRFAGVEPPETMPAVDLRTEAGLGPERPILLEATGRDHQWRAIVRGDEKWSVMVRGPRRRVKRRSHATLGADERETASGPWVGSDPAAAELLELVRTDPDPSGIPREFENGIAIHAPKVAPRVDAQTLEKLKTLGYAE
jgi:arylsulfatase A-like enzyme